MEETSPHKLRDWFRIIPARKTDYFLLGFLMVDLTAILIWLSYRDLLPEWTFQYFRYFDFGLIGLWSLDLFLRSRRQAEPLRYISAHWYEALGLIPLQPFRFLLILRAAKIGIAFVRLLRSDREVGQLVVEEITFRFRDIFVDTISDAVFLRSLERVQEVMDRLDYVALARGAFQKHQEPMMKAVHSSIHSKSMVGELSKVPLMGSFVNRLGEDVSKIIIEVLETEVTGNIVKDMTTAILSQMGERVRLLDLERLTGRRVSLKTAAEHASDQADHSQQK